MVKLELTLTYFAIISSVESHSCLLVPCTRLVRPRLYILYLLLACFCCCSSLLPICLLHFFRGSKGAQKILRFVQHPHFFVSFTWFCLPCTSVQHRNWHTPPQLRTITSLSAMDSWQSDLHKVRVHLKDLRQIASERDRKRRQGGSAKGNGTKARDLLEKLNDLIYDLDKRLEAARRDGGFGSGITEQECDRRRGLLADVKRDRNKIKTLVGVQNDTYGSVSKEALFAAGSKTTRPDNYAGRDLEAEGTRGMNDRGLLQQQQDTMRRQDEGLDSLGDTIGDLKNLGTAIGEGLDLTTALLGDVQQRVDKTDAALQKRTDKAKTLVGKVSSNCWCYMAIVFLILFLIANIATNGFCEIVKTGCSS